MSFPAPPAPLIPGGSGKRLNVSKECVWGGGARGGDGGVAGPDPGAAAPRRRGRGGRGGGGRGSRELAGPGASQEGGEGSACLPRRAVLIARSSSLLCFP